MRNFLLLVVLAVSLTACGSIKNDGAEGTKGSGNVKTETRNLSGFKKIKADSAVALEVSFKPEYSVTLEGDDNILPQFTTEVDGDKLIITSKGKVTTQSRVKVRITMPELTFLDLNGAVDATVTGVKGENLEVDANGASRLKIDGEVRELDADATGASKFGGDDLKVENAKVKANGASYIIVNASGELKAEANGASGIMYIGEPRKLEQQSAGASSITKK